MKLLIVVTALAVLGHVSCQQPCCTPDQWEGSVLSIVARLEHGSPVITRPNTTYAYDYHNERAASVTHMTDSSGNPVAVQSIALYKEKTAYFINLIAGTCTRSDLEQEMTKLCVPADAVKEGDLIFGTKGGASLSATQYAFKVPGQSADTIGTVAVTKDNCLPVTETVYGDFNGVQALQATEFANLQLGISNPGIFNVPSSCDQAPFEKMEDMRMPSMMAL